MTPMMEQYLKKKEEHKDAILFFRLGDFYEMFFDDAIVASEALGITLTSRACGEEEKAPMCGVPYHAYESYMGRLIEKGFSVAICEQMDVVDENGVIIRDVVRVVTPGTCFNDEVLDKRQINYIASLYKRGTATACAFCDVTTGSFFVTSFENDKDCNHIMNELFRFMPVEVIKNTEASKNDMLNNFISLKICATNKRALDDIYVLDVCKKMLIEQFGEQAETCNETEALASGALLKYLEITQKTALVHLLHFEKYSTDEFLKLDASAIRNLELFETMLDKQKKGSFFWAINHTLTPMGGRLLRKNISMPLVNSISILGRLQAVDNIIKDMTLCEDLRDVLKGFPDMERNIAKISTGNANPRDLLSLKCCCSNLREMKQMLQYTQARLLRSFYDDFDDLYDVWDFLDRAIAEDAPINIRDGNVIKLGFDEEVERYRYVSTQGEKWLQEFEERERQDLGIKALKVGYNKVFGYYIEVTKTHINKVPKYYIRKQTMSNAERYYTEELKEFEEKIINSAENLRERELLVFGTVLDLIRKNIPRILKMAGIIAQIDMLSSFAYIAKLHNYVRPNVDTGCNLRIDEGRHPVVELSEHCEYFMPNDTLADSGDNCVAVITGPNMAGKSTYMRQVALIVIMAQMGCYVPAKFCHVGVVDRLFTRIGAGDDLTGGRSTFMVEMCEVAQIAQNATKKSLLILDEVGRGTSTYDGLAICWALLEFCAKLRVRTLFATHYHELAELEGKLHGAVNYCVSAKRIKGNLEFLHKLERGASDDSYGLDVAQLAGVPKRIVDRAKEVLVDIENSERTFINKYKDDNESTALFDLVNNAVIDRISELDLCAISPHDAMGFLLEMQKLIKSKKI